MLHFPSRSTPESSCSGVPGGVSIFSTIYKTRVSGGSKGGMKLGGAKDP